MTTGAIKGAEVGFHTQTVPTQQLGRYGYCSEREEELAEFTKMYSPKSTPSLTRTSVAKSDAPPRVTQARACLSYICLRSVRAPRRPSPRKLSCFTYSEREEESATFKDMYLPRSPFSLFETD